MYVLYWNPISSSLAPMAVLEEIGAAYEAVLVDLDKGENLTAAYRKIHPYGRVPALSLPEGAVVFESAGLVMTLCDRHPTAGLAPGLESVERALYYQWLLFLTDSIYPSYNRIYRAERYAGDNAARAEVQASAEATLDEQWQIVEQGLEGRAWLTGAEFCAADIYLTMLATWFQDQDAFARRYPNARRVAEAAAERPAVRRALDMHS